jgi:DNA-directed RNA polymerase specialized sigma24 family protein
MLSQAQRTTILELNIQGVSKREIARVLAISRVAVRKVLRSNSTALPELHRTEKAEPYPATDPGAFREVQAESRASP